MSRAMLLSERKLIVACVVCSVVGIAALFVIAAVTEPLQVSPSEVKELGVRNSGGSAKVKVAGFVDSVSVLENNAVIKIAAVEAVEAVSFDTGYIRGLGLKRFQEVEATGEVRQYKGRNSLVVSSLRLVNNSAGSGPVLSSALGCGG